MTHVLDDRNPDAKALLAWRNQQRKWDNMAKSLAEKIDRPQEDMLTTNSYAFRRRIEDVNRIDLSVPSVVRVAEASWEMSLRGNGAGGVRYVPVGSSFPYPLYCPIPSTDDMSTDHPAFMRVLVSDSVKEPRLSRKPFYQQRFKELSKFIRNKFTHVNKDVSEEPFSVEGKKMPIQMTECPPGEMDDIEPVLFYPAPKISESSAAAVELGASVTKAARKSAAFEGTGLSNAVEASAPPPSALSGPMLVLGASRLVFNCGPGQLSLASLKVDNVGTTAVYYQWRVLPRDVIVPNHHAAKTHGASSYFNLSDATSGVLLPDDEKFFTFSFMHSDTGIYSESWELLTVPSGVERIVINLRGVVVTVHDDVASRTRLREKLADRLSVDISRGFFTEVMNAEYNNVFRDSAREAETREKAQRDAMLQKFYDEQHDSQRASYLRANGALGLRYYDAVMVSMALLHKNVYEHLRGDGPDTPSKNWDCSVRTLLELILLVPDPVVRGNMTTVFDSIVTASTARDLPEDASMLTLLLHGFVRRGLCQFADDLSAAAITLKEGLGLIEAAPRTGTKKGEKPKVPPKASKAPGTTKGQGGRAGGATEDEALPPQEEYNQQIPIVCRRVLLDCIEVAMTGADASAVAVQHVTQQPVNVSFSERLKEWEMVAAQMKLEAAKTPTPVLKKR